LSINQEDLLGQKEEDSELKKSGHALKTYARLTSLGFELVALVLLALFINKQTETQLNLNGLGPALFLFLAMGIWIYRIIVTLNKIDKEENNNANKVDK
jgi:hypothetical protein